MQKRDYYQVLGISRDAGEGDLKRAYRKLAMENHPDRNPGDKEAEERFKEAAEAYDVLRDREKREIYDRFGHQGLEGSGFRGFSGFEDIFPVLAISLRTFLALGRGAGVGSGPVMIFDMIWKSAWKRPSPAKRKCSPFISGRAVRIVMDRA
jgi:molecular chaperone DnaJ